VLILLLDDDLIVSRIKASDDTILCNKYNRNRLQVSTAVFNRRIEISRSFERQIKIPRRSFSVVGGHSIGLSCSLDNAKCNT
jgi:hypothetical protein